MIFFNYGNQNLVHRLFAYIEQRLSRTGSYASPPRLIKPRASEQQQEN
ncbi:hypothetical protein Hdeb2414_s0008g00281731 [Helianthus debilis subsp. tardiflorus]